MEKPVGIAHPRVVAICGCECFTGRGINFDKYEKPTGTHRYFYHLPNVSMDTIFI